VRTFFLPLLLFDAAMALASLLFCSLGACETDARALCHASPASPHTVAGASLLQVLLVYLEQSFWLTILFASQLPKRASHAPELTTCKRMETASREDIFFGGTAGHVHCSIIMFSKPCYSFRARYQAKSDLRW
jgi:hypothetical protein